MTASEGSASTAQAVIIGFPDFGVGTAALLAFGRRLQKELGAAANYLDVSTRYTIEREVIRIGKIPPGFPRQLLHRYMFGYGSPLILTPAQFLNQVGPRGSIYNPNSQNGNPTEHPNRLYEDIKKNFPKGAAKPEERSFEGQYRFSCFHTAHSTAGLGRFTMHADVRVRGTSPSDWQLEGTAELEPNAWDFDWEAKALLLEVTESHPLDETDLHGRERRTAAGSTLPGTPFIVSMSGPVHAQEFSGGGVPNVVFSL